MVDVEDVRKWYTIYPAYIQKKRTIAEGRRVSDAIAVVNPQAAEIAEVCRLLNLPYHLEPDKAYSRDWMMKGRVKVKILDKEGKPILPDVKNKRQLLHKIATLLPRLPSRVNAKDATQASSGGKKDKKKGKK